LEKITKYYILVFTELGNCEMLSLRKCWCIVLRSLTWWITTMILVKNW